MAGGVQDQLQLVGPHTEEHPGQGSGSHTVSHMGHESRTTRDVSFAYGHWMRHVGATKHEEPGLQVAEHEGGAQEGVQIGAHVGSLHAQEHTASAAGSDGPMQAPAATESSRRKTTIAFFLQFFSYYLFHLMGRHVTRTPRLRLRRRRLPFEAVTLERGSFCRAARRVCREQKWREDRVAALAEECMRALYCKVATFEDPLSLSLPPKLDAVWHALILETKEYRRVCRALGADVEHTTAGADDSVAEKNARVDQTVRHYQVLFNAAPDDWCWERECERPIRLQEVNSNRSFGVMPGNLRTLGDALEEAGLSAADYVCSFGGRNWPADTLLADAAIQGGSIVLLKPADEDCYYGKTINGATYKIETGVRTVRDFLTEVQRQGGPPVEMMQFIFAGRRYDCDDVLEGIGFESGHVAHLVQNMRGC